MAFNDKSGGPWGGGSGQNNGGPGGNPWGGGSNQNNNPDLEDVLKNICELNKSYMQSINEESIIGLIQKNKLL